MIELTECTRDAIQGIKKFIPTEKKINYLNKVLESNCFEYLDFGSFVSHKAMPQMADTNRVVKKLKIDNTKTKLLAIIANLRGANEASHFEEIDTLGFPFSISETFQKRNTNKSIEESFVEIAEINKVCVKANKKLRVYLSMGFGNPYGDPWNLEVLSSITSKLIKEGIQNLALSDTIGIANANQIEEVFTSLSNSFPKINFGAHLHTIYEEWESKVIVLENSKCKSIDGSIMGYGGCPMAQNELVGNMPSEKLLSFFNKAKKETILEIERAFKELLS